MPLLLAFLFISSSALSYSADDLLPLGRNFEGRSNSSEPNATCTSDVDASSRTSQRSADLWRSIRLNARRLLVIESIQLGLFASSVFLTPPVQGLKILTRALAASTLALATVNRPLLC